MKKILRLSAVIWFLLFVLLMSALAYGLSGPLTRWSIEKSLQSSSELPVTVESASVSLMPLSITVSGIQWPDSENKQNNAFVMQQIQAKLRFGPLLRGNVIIDEASIGPVLTNQTRSIPWEPLPVEQSDEEPGALEPVTEAAKEKVRDLTQQASLSAEEILKEERDNLITRKQANELKTQSSALINDLDQLRMASPKDSDITVLKSRFQALSKSKLDSPEAISRFDSEWKKLRNDINALKAASLAPIERLDKGSKALQVTVSELNQAPKADWENLSNKYQPGNVDTGALSQQLFGSKYSGYIEQGLYWYEKAKPWLPENDADEDKNDDQTKDNTKTPESKVWVFPTDNPEPGFWLKTASLTLLTDKGMVFTQLENWSSDLKQIKKPATAVFNRHLGDETFEGTLTVVPGQQTLVFNSKNQRVNSLNLMPGVKIDSAQMDSELNLKMEQQEMVLRLNNQFSHSVWNNEKNETLPGVLADGLTTIENFDINLNATGTLRKPKVAISSNLDKKLGQFWKGEIDKKWQQTQKDIQNGLLSEVSEATSSFDADKKEIETARRQLTEKADELQLLLDGGMEQKISDAKKELQRKLEAEKKKIESELKNKLKLPGL